MFDFAFPPFFLIGWVINEVLWESTEAMVLATLTWNTQPGINLY